MSGIGSDAYPNNPALQQAACPPTTPPQIAQPQGPWERSLEAEYERTLRVAEEQARLRQQAELEQQRRDHAQRTAALEQQLEQARAQVAQARASELAQQALRAELEARARAAAAEATAAIARTTVDPSPQASQAAQAARDAADAAAQAANNAMDSETAAAADIWLPVVTTTIDSNPPDPLARFNR
jgi:hypothetical protein